MWYTTLTPMSPRGVEPTRLSWCPFRVPAGDCLGLWTEALLPDAHLLSCIWNKDLLPKLLWLYWPYIFTTTWRRPERTTTRASYRSDVVTQDTSMNLSITALRGTTLLYLRYPIDFLGVSVMPRSVWDTFFFCLQQAGH